MGTATLGERKLVRGRERSCRRAPGSHCRVKCVPPGVARWGQIPGDVPEGLHIPPGPPGHRKQDVYGVRDPYRACRSSLCEEILVTGAYSLCPAPLIMRLHRPDPPAASSFRGRFFCPSGVGSHPFLFDVLHPNPLRPCS